MAKTRLRNDDRDAIRYAIIDHKFKPLDAALDAEGTALALKARAKAYGDFATVMDNAPQGAFDTASSISVNVAGKRISLPFKAEARAFYSHRHSYQEALTLTEADRLAVQIMAWANQGEALKAERRTLNDQVRGTLSAFHTFDDLQRDWPEADAFITARWRTRPEYSSSVPAVRLAALTSALDLPPEVAEAA
jgi:hypothetical protein